MERGSGDRSGRSLLAAGPGMACGLAVLASLLTACTRESGRDPPPVQSPRAATSDPERLSPARILSGKPQYSQHNEELIIRHFFRDRRDGFFLDVGCASPIAHSNTYYLEHHLGWSGIGVDALAEYGPAWQLKRPKSKFLSYLITDHADAVEPFYRAPQHRGTSSALKDWKRPGRDPTHVEKILVPTITLDRLLEQNGVTRIDFLSLDIEGAEPQALAGFDIARFRPELACVEAKPQNRDKILKYFADHGYRRLHRYIQFDAVNYYFTPAAEAP
jgi:FkbM family methyltransferase